MPLDPTKPAEWGIMTDRERAAWEKAHAAPEKPAAPAPGSVEAEIEEQRQRAGGYLRNQHTDHMN